MDSWFKFLLMINYSLIYIKDGINQTVQDSSNTDLSPSSLYLSTVLSGMP